MNNSKIKSKFKSKARESFGTKLNLYLLHKHLREDPGNISMEDFKKFRITEELVNVYTTKYWNWYTDKPFNAIPSKINYKVKTKETINELYKKMKDWREDNSDLIKEIRDDYIRDFESIFPLKDFENMLKTEKCHYCGITIKMVNDLVDKEQIFKKKLTRGFVLEIDRIRPNEEYTKENSVMCCYWCNNAKTDEFTEKEFLKIGKVIKKIWKDRISK